MNISLPQPPTLDWVAASGIGIFLTRYCPRPEILKPLFARSGRVLRLHDGDILCRAGDRATEIWIVDDGEVHISGESFQSRRRAGDLVGEAALYRLSETGERAAVRGATMRASGDADLYRIDWQFLSEMSDVERAVWHETAARVLTRKLDEAVAQRDRLIQDRHATESLVARFVSAEGHQAAMAAVRPGRFVRHIDAETCGAIVWFSDIAGFSSHAAGSPAAETGTMVREFMDIQTAAIEAAGGQVDKYMGDGLMAFWRTPDESRLSDAAQRAVSAALACERTLVDHFARCKLPFDIRIGLHCGDVIFGDFGGSERIAFTLIGETVNSASRYEQAKTCVEQRPLGRVRVSPAVFRHVQATEVLESFEPQPREFADKHATRFAAHVSRLGDGR